jgi:hypothetical protein
VQADRDAFVDIDPKGPRTMDAKFNGVFTKIFGGTDAANVAGYLDARIKYYFTEDDLNAFSLKQTPGFNDDTEIEVGAVNMGMALWLSSLIKGEHLTLMREGQTIEVNDSRVGIMQIGPGYRKDELDVEGQKFSLGTVRREGILLHEARHSDCSGGVTRAQVEDLQRTGNPADSSFPHECGHVHVICPAGTYHGQPACDDLPYGAYSVNLIYDLAEGVSAKTDEAVFEALITDDLSRLLFDPDQTLSWTSGTPDMTSAGVQL